MLVISLQKAENKLSYVFSLVEACGEVIGW